MKATIKDVAKLAGVSPTVVSHALNNTPGTRTNKETRQKVAEAARNLNYQPNFAARSFVLQKSFNIGIVVCRSNESFPLLTSLCAFEVLRGIQDTLKNSGYRMSFFSADNLQTFDYKALFAEKWVDGLIILEPVFADLETLEAETKKERLPIVTVNNRLPGTRLNYVDIDNESGIFQAVKHLVRLGYKKIGFVGGPLNQSNFVERLDAYKKALKENGLNCDPETVIKKRPEDYNRIIEKWIAGRKCPEAIVAANDAIAIEMIQALSKCGLSVPADVGMVGFDDIEISSRLNPPLTTVRQPMHEIGEVAAGELIALLHNKGVQKQITRVLPAELVVRESCGVKYRLNPPTAVGAGR